MMQRTLEERLAMLRRRRRPGMVRIVARALGWTASGLLLVLLALLIAIGR